jgi:hypothetical protein
MLNKLMARTGKKYLMLTTQENILTLIEQENIKFAYKQIKSTKT